MTASRRLYNAMAAELKKSAPSPTLRSPGFAEAERLVWRSAVRAVARSFYSDNSGFDTIRFLRASGFTDEEIAAYPHGS